MCHKLTFKKLLVNKMSQKKALTKGTCMFDSVQQ